MPLIHCSTQVVPSPSPNKLTYMLMPYFILALPFHTIYAIRSLMKILILRHTVVTKTKIGSYIFPLHLHN